MKIIATGENMLVTIKNTAHGNKLMVNKTAGFTLTELLVVLVILGLLAALVGPTLYQRIKPAKQSVAATQISHFSSALDNFFVDMGRFPTSSEGLDILYNRPRNDDHWQGPYVKKEVPLDPWGNVYHYRIPGQNGGYDIISYGADGKPGGEGEDSDINSWESR